MSAVPGWRRRDEGGFTITELLVAIVILGIISVILTEAVILGLRTTDATAANTSRSVATQTLASYFTDDAQSASAVSTTDLSCTASPVLLHLAWTDQGVNRDVSYALEPPAGREQTLVRWSCTGDGDPTRKVLGHFSGDGAAPVAVRCDEGPCPSTPGSPAPARVAVEIDGTPPLTVTVRRRSP